MSEYLLATLYYLDVNKICLLLSCYKWIYRNSETNYIESVFTWNKDIMSMEFTANERYAYIVCHFIHKYEHIDIRTVYRNLLGVCFDSLRSSKIILYFTKFSRWLIFIWLRIALTLFNKLFLIHSITLHAALHWKRNTGSR